MLSAVHLSLLVSCSSSTLVLKLLRGVLVHDLVELRMNQGWRLSLMVWLLWMVQFSCSVMLLGKMTRLLMLLRVMVGWHGVVSDWVLAGRKLIKVDFEGATLELVAVEHLDCVERILRGRKEHGTEASAPSVRTQRYVRAQDLSRCSEEIFQILPLAVERDVADKQMAVRVVRAGRVAVRVQSLVDPRMGHTGRIVVVEVHKPARHRHRDWSNESLLVLLQVERMNSTRMLSWLMRLLLLLLSKRGLWMGGAGSSAVTSAGPTIPAVCVLRSGLGLIPISIRGSSRSRSCSCSCFFCLVFYRVACSCSSGCRSGWVGKVRVRGHVGKDGRWHGAKASRWSSSRRGGGYRGRACGGGGSSTDCTRGSCRLRKARTRTRTSTDRAATECMSGGGVPGRGTRSGGRSRNSSSSSHSSPGAFQC